MNNMNRPRLGNIINRVFESAGPDGKVRGTPQQIIDKYQMLARDAQLGNDRVAAESFLQHSEHYSRMLNEATQAQNEQRQTSEREDGQRDDGQQDGQRDGQGRDTQQRDFQPRDSQQRDTQQRDTQHREFQPRDSQPRDGHYTDQQPRDGQGRDRDRDRDQPRHRQDDPQRQPARDVPSSLATIDTKAEGEAGEDSLVYTPERKRRGPATERAQAPEAVPADPAPLPNGAAEAAPAEVAADEAPPKPKRGRPRRKAAPEPEAPATTTSE